jgi:hypothetical protein
MRQQLLSKTKYGGVIDIIEKEKNKFEFHIGSLGEGNKRCTIGLLLSHFGWQGQPGISSNFRQANEALGKLIETWDQWFIVNINDMSHSFDEVQKMLRKVETI